MKTRIALSLALLAFSATADVYKCRQPNGNTEISSSPCVAGSSTVKTVADEVISAESRRQAERNVEQMRIDAERLEATRRADEAIERKQQEEQRPAGRRPAQLRIACAHLSEWPLMQLVGQSWRPSAAPRVLSNRFMSRFPIMLPQLTAGQLVPSRRQSDQRRVNLKPCRRRLTLSAHATHPARPIAPTRRQRAITSRVNPR